MIAAMTNSGRSVSIIVPAFREAPNIKPLTQRLFSALAEAELAGELIVVDDDSRDGTEAIVAELTATYPVRVMVRKTEKGLSSAVLAGLAEAKYDNLLVMDADLQHPPESVPAMVAALEADDCEFVLGTRYGGDGALDPNWPLLRRLGSKGATALAQPLCRVSDPMSGFFALRRSVLNRAERLNPIGYKIGLELLVKAGCRRVREVPIHFAARTAGASKLGAGETFRYLWHLNRLYRFRFPLFWWTMAGIKLLLLVAIVWWIVA